MEEEKGAMEDFKTNSAWQFRSVVTCVSAAIFLHCIAFQLHSEVPLELPFWAPWGFFSLFYLQRLNKMAYFFLKSLVFLFFLQPSLPSQWFHSQVSKFCRHSVVPVSWRISIQHVSTVYNSCFLPVSPCSQMGTWCQYKQIVGIPTSQYWSSVFLVVVRIL